jgi:type IV fimbrial biogenesis protein FimT
MNAAMDTHTGSPARVPLLRGLTLLEVLAVLAVVAVLASLTLGSMGALAQRHQLTAAAEALAADLVEARMEAARSGQVLHVQSQWSALVAPAGNRWCWSVATDAGCDCQAAVAPSCRLKAVRADDHPGVSLLQPLEVRLNPLGTADGMALSAELQSARGDRLRVELGALGRTRICVPATPATPGGVGRHPAC